MAASVVIAKLVDRDPSTLDGLHVLIRSETIESVVEETFISDTAFGTGVE
jgi:cobalamin biosynthesis protein CobD/CbiB